MGGGGGGDGSPPAKAAEAGGDGERKWQLTFRRLGEMVRASEARVEALEAERAYLERFIQLRDEQWSAHVAMLKSRLAQVQKEVVKRRRFQAAKAGLLIGAREREVLRYKKQAELAESDLADFRTCVDVLAAEKAELKVKLKEAENHAEPSETTKDEGHSETTVRGELRKLKQAYRTLSSKKEKEVSTLFAEKDFVWNQLKTMEQDYTALLKIKKIEAAQATEAAEKLQQDLEELQALTQEKDKKIERLQAEHFQLQTDVRKHTQEAQDAKERISVFEHELQEARSLAQRKDDEIEKLKGDVDKLAKDITTSSRKVGFSEALESSQKLRYFKGTPFGSRVRVSGKRGLNAKQAGSSSRKDSAKQKLGSAQAETIQKRKRVSRDSSGPQASSLVNGLRRCSARLLQQKTASPMANPVLFSSSFKVPKLKTAPPPEPPTLV